MKRLTKHWGNNYVPTNLNLAFIFNLTDEENKNLQAIIKRLAEYEDTGFTPDEIRKLHKKTQIDIGQTVYVVTRYIPFGDWEVVECKITRKTVKTRSSFSVEGCYKNSNFYNATFVENSIGKTVFLNKEDAEKECKKRKR